MAPSYSPGVVEDGTLSVSPMRAPWFGGTVTTGCCALSVSQRPTACWLAESLNARLPPCNGVCASEVCRLTFRDVVARLTTASTSETDCPGDTMNVKCRLDGSVSPTRVKIGLAGTILKLIGLWLWEIGFGPDADGVGDAAALRDRGRAATNAPRQGTIRFIGVYQSLFI